MDFREYHFPRRWVNRIRTSVHPSRYLLFLGQATERGTLEESVAIGGVEHGANFGVECARDGAIYERECRRIGAGAELRLR